MSDFNIEAAQAALEAITSLSADLSWAATESVSSFWLFPVTSQSREGGDLAEYDREEKNR